MISLLLPPFLQRGGESRGCLSPPQRPAPAWMCPLCQPDVPAATSTGTRVDSFAPEQQRLREIPVSYLSVSVYSPWILLEASRTRKVPSGVSRSFSFTSSLRGTGMIVTAREAQPELPRTQQGGHTELELPATPLPGNVTPVPLGVLQGHAVPVGQAGGAGLWLRRLWRQRCKRSRVEEGLRRG